MSRDRSLEGWAPEPSAELSLAEIVELAFDYRGNTTVVLVDGRELHGFVFNRDVGAAEPFIQMFDADGAGPIRIRYAEIRTVRFTGKDPAAGNSYTAWLRRREQQNAERAAGGRGQDDHAPTRR